MEGGQRAGGPRRVRVNDRLLRATRSAARAQSVDLSPEGDRALRDLVSRAVRGIDDQGLIDDDDAITRAERSLVQITGELAAPHIGQGVGPPSPTPTGRIGGNEVMRAFRGLCPGLWPLC